MPCAFSYRMSLCLLTGLLLAACGGEGSSGDAPEADPSAGAEAEAAADVPAAAGQPAEPVSATISADDIDRWERGMAAELAAVKEAGAKLGSAKSGEDTLSALMGVQEMTTTPTGAKAAGMDPELYQTVRSNLGAAVAYLTPQLGGIDTTMLSPTQREEMRRMNAAQLKQLEGTVPAEVIEALKPRAEALRKLEIELAGARMKGAGM